MVSSFINDVLALSHVPRWAIVRATASQSVADHSFRVAAITLELAHRMKIEVRPALILHALFHDVDESVSGDIPANYKKMVRVTPSISPVILPIYVPVPTLAERKLVKLADLIEAYTWIEANGVGPHADEVEHWVGQQLTELMRNKNIDPATVIQLISEIRMELGRLHLPVEESD